MIPVPIKVTAPRIVAVSPSVAISPSPKNNKKNIIWPVPPKFYSNSDTCKVKILLENKNKSGIYM